ncbi:MAG: LytTR family DNA-binding domain-containing protein [Reichenbachiella sp.]|uniref:LytR/AlgR family response regulator transcription factor n=1 Tax=Reichenbachiella sp. TaxID=2184521 RepID=UPI003266EA03
MIRCIAIEDEPLALGQIESYINKTPFLVLSGSFDNALEALEFLGTEPVDLIFTDINMPDLNGMDFVKLLQHPPKVIFTTAYEEYAIEGYKVDALDYLLKPIGYTDFLKAANKANLYFENQPASSVETKSTDDFLFIKSEYKVIRVNFSDIKYIEGMREYVRIHLINGKPLMSLMSMKKIEEHLPGNRFMRVHRSYIVNLAQVSTVEKMRIIFDGKVYIPISDQYKESFQQYMDNHFL